MEDEVVAWQAKRNASCAEPFGWLSLIGLEWLKEGAENTLGGAKSGASVCIEASAIPDTLCFAKIELNSIENSK